MIRTLFLFLLIATPAKAITWNEFWEPFNEQPQKSTYPKRVNVVCKKEIYYEQYIQANSYSPGYIKRWVDIKQIPC